MAKKPSAHEQWMWAQSRLQAAERLAGIENALKELNQRNAYVASSDQHFSDLREIVFAVEDETHRKSVIKEHRECHRLCIAKEHEELESLRKTIRSAGDPIRRQRLWGAIGFAVFIVWLASYWFGTTGALIAAVASLLIGVDNILKGDRIALAELQNAHAEIPKQLAHISELGADGLFSEAEEKSGRADPPDVVARADRPRW